jgi:hypothetical protein
VLRAKTPSSDPIITSVADTKAPTANVGKVVLPESLDPTIPVHPRGENGSFTFLLRQDYLRKDLSSIIPTSF